MLDQFYEGKNNLIYYQSEQCVEHDFVNALSVVNTNFLLCHEINIKQRILFKSWYMLASFCFRITSRENTTYPAGKIWNKFIIYVCFDIFYVHLILDGKVVSKSSPMLTSREIYIFIVKWGGSIILLEGFYCTIV